MHEINHLTSLIGFLVFMAANCMVENVVNENRMNDFPHHLIQKSEINTHFVGCDFETFAANMSLSYNTGDITEGDCNKCNDGRGYYYGCGCFPGPVPTTGCDVLFFGAAFGPFTTVTGPYVTTCDCDPPFRCAPPFHFYCGCFNMQL